MRLDMEISLDPCEKVTVSVHHPYEEYVGEFSYGEAVSVPVMPYRVVLVEVCNSNEADIMLTGCRYEVLHEDENVSRIKSRSYPPQVKSRIPTDPHITDIFRHSIIHCAVRKSLLLSQQTTATPYRRKYQNDRNCNVCTGSRFA